MKQIPRIKKASLIIFAVISVLMIFLRFYEIETKSPFGWDQVDNAWAAKNIIVNHKFPIVGMQAKLNSGIVIGPFYYYLVSIFYFLTNLNPIASGIFAGLTSVFTFWSIFYITKKLFSFETSLIAIFINTVAFWGIIFDRVQWPVNFIPAISLIIFYSLYKIITGESKYVLLLAIALGFSFHIHFTSIFFLFIILFSLPFFPRTKQMLKFTLVAFPLFFIWLIPIVIFQVQNLNHTSGVLTYSQAYYHGFHLRRVLQLTNDALIQFEPFFTFSILKPLKFILIPLFVFVYLFRSVTKGKLKFCYLLILWFVVPWFVFSTYGGEISDYYFATNRFIVLIIIAYLLARVFLLKYSLPKIALACFLIYYAVFNVSKFFSYQDVGIYERNKEVFKAIKEGRGIGFKEGIPESYLYYYYMRKEGKEVY